MRSLSALALTICTLLFSASTIAAPFAEGPKKCQECHEAEYGVWENTEHAKSYKTIHKSDKAAKILEAVGAKSMKKSPDCQLCHYTMVQKDADAKPKAKAGPSCESCHGPSSDWRDIHNDYGGANVKADNEPAEHKKKRQDDAKAAGMIWSFMHYDIASNCMSCHGLAQKDLDADTLAKMLGAGHPMKSEFELVMYSQGTVRHRFYPPDVSKNAEMTKAELARFFVTGQAAKLVSASAAASKSNNADYQKAQQERVAGATEVLLAVKSVPQAAALVASPTEDNARKLVDAIKDKDLSGEVGGMLPSPSSYK